MKILDPGWQFVGRCTEGQPIEVSGQNPWDAPWASGHGSIEVVDHLRGPEPVRVPLYMIDSSAGRVLFAATESSNCVWGFWEPITPELDAETGRSVGSD